ncbi:NADP-dependent oxidoreductase domain-containing protein [Lipomyces chichibuensis]|uniref:NADP-dependent oxidoreductase domain-containing protein n=1 Tax=Lipomyces chichibuensis TaxID=1546026 RepID=UPI003343B241
MSICTKKFLLNSGFYMPAVGLGTWQGQSGSKAAAEMRDTIVYALQKGYRHIDTAAVYGVEEIVGEAIRMSGVPRSEIFLVTKLPSTHHAHVEEAFLESMKRLNCEYIDLYLMHWPQSLTLDGKPTKTPTPPQTWLSMEALKLKYPDQVRSLGVSNFSEKTMEELLKVAKIVPATNQIEVHPMLPQHDLVKYMNEKGILTTCYSPLGQYVPAILQNPRILDLASKYNVTAAQIVLAWEVSRDLVVIPKSTNLERIMQNITYPELAPEDIAFLNDFYMAPGMHRRLCQINGGTPTGHDIVMGWTYEELGWEPFTVE